MTGLIQPRRRPIPAELDPRTHRSDPPRSRGDGSTILLTIFYGFLALVVVLLVVSASSLYLERKRLLTLADGAAIAAAESFDLTAVTAESGTLRAHLSTGQVARAVEDYVTASTPREFDALSIDTAESRDGRSATVTLSAVWHPPILSLLVPTGVPLEVTAVARSVFFR